MNWRTRQIFLILTIAMLVILLGVAPIGLSLFKWDAPIAEFGGETVTRGDVYDVLSSLVMGLDLMVLSILVWTFWKRRGRTDE